MNKQKKTVIIVCAALMVAALVLVPTVMGRYRQRQTEKAEAQYYSQIDAYFKQSGAAFAAVSKSVYAEMAIKGWLSADKAQPVSEFVFETQAAYQGALALKPPTERYEGIHQAFLSGLKAMAESANHLMDYTAHSKPEDFYSFRASADDAIDAFAKAVDQAQQYVDGK